jgi:hypothetical protein
MPRIVRASLPKLLPFHSAPRLEHKHVWSLICAHLRHLRIFNYETPLLIHIALAE